MLMNSDKQSQLVRGVKVVNVRITLLVKRTIFTFFHKCLSQSGDLDNTQMKQTLCPFMTM